MQVDEPEMLPDLDDHRQWTQQHLDAADLRISSMAPTPPQGEIDADCMDVNVRGPGGGGSGHCSQARTWAGRASRGVGAKPGSLRGCTGASPELAWECSAGHLLALTAGIQAGEWPAWPSW